MMNTVATAHKSELEQGALLDEIDRKIIRATQSGLPLVSRPYDDVASRVGISAGEVIARMHTMQQRGIIRRIAAVPNHYSLGYKSNGMTVWDVPDDRVNELGRQVGVLGFVSHCYHRPRYLPDWPYNLFAMVHAHNRDEAMLLVSRIADLLGDADRGHDVLFSQRILKKTGLRLST
ncbi:AsnC family transcriptional regulator [Sulfuriflexus mobilis]|uniref:siroheme decarboxylase subunit beta n=1 Tax=Sulfuriflexus mobilis TaxID=1811807 RepID=UPI001E50DB67|nr:AsnC family transcriptional regulator [Sulfuriflexus mobilis]